ncbi:MAG: MOSC domain-containing protein [Pseudomonadota bacterium]
MNPVKLEAIHRFPVKGFPSQSLKQARLELGKGIPGDRRYAITNGTVSNGEWMLARSYFINAYNDGLQKFDVCENTNDGSLTLKNPDGHEMNLLPENPQSLELANLQLERFLNHVTVKPDAPAPQVIERKQAESNWDYPGTELSIINAQSVQAIGTALDRELDPVRFRGNLIIRDLPAWEEFDLLGKRLRIGEAEIEVMFPIVRCPAPGVNPATGERDIDFAETFPAHFGHAYCGMYAKVVSAGKIVPEDRIEIVGDAEMPLSEAQAEADPYPLWPRMMEIEDYTVDIMTTRLTLKNTSPWPLPKAEPGQRLKLHIGSGRWTREYIKEASSEQYHLEIEDSKTGDPMTQILREGLANGERIVVTGPFGQPRS